MEKARTLPPLVRGKVTAVLDFFIDKISIESTSLLINTLGLVVEVQWWGENSPIYLRPKKAQYQHYRINGKFDSVEMDFHEIARYEIKTTLELFKLYLKACEVLELCVLDAVKRCIIGSAFLRDLFNLLNQSSNFITAPIFDYLGEKIGEIVICFSFLNRSQQNTVKKHDKINYIYKNKLNTQNFKISNRAMRSCFIPTGNNSFNNIYEEINLGEFTSDSELSEEKYELKKNKEVEYVKYAGVKKGSNSTKNVKALHVNSEKVAENISSHKCLPEITTSNDSSKILYFGVNPQKSKQKVSVDYPEMRMKNKFNSNLIKSKSNAKSTENLRSFHSDKSVGQPFQKRSSNKGAVFKNCTKTSLKTPKTVDLKQFKDSSVCKSEEHSNNNQNFIKNTPSKECTEAKVLDFLLGADLNKEDEERAVNEFKKMSPSQDLVMSLSQLCLTSDNGDYSTSGKKFQIDSLGSPKPIGLTFDLNNPIERNYYEKFFLKSELFPDLELAEFLNHPKNSAVLEKLKSGDKNSNKSSPQTNNSFKSSENPLIEEKNPNPMNKENFLEHCNKTNETAKGCARCKYYKKLDELDKIIESLKHFETKMLLHEKNMESAFTEKSEIFFKSTLDNS